MEELWHPRRRPESLRIRDPITYKLGRQLRLDVSQRRPNLAHRASDLGWIGRNARRFRLGRRFQTQIGTDRLRAVEALNLMAAEAAVFLNQVVTFVNLWRAGPELGMHAQFDDGMMTLNTGRLAQPLRLHWVFPEVVRGVMQ